MKYCYFKIISVLFSFTLLYGCSYSDLTDLWPTSQDSEEEIVIREIPSESYDPEETDEMVIANEVEASDETDATAEITILEDDDTSTSSLDSLLEEESQQATVSDDNTISMTNSRGTPVFTYVGQRVIEMQDEFNKLDNDISQRKLNFDQLKFNGIKSAENYHAIVAAISARLQIGTTPGNPILLNQYEEAQTELAEVSTQGQVIVDVGNQIALLSTRVAYLLEQARSAKKLRGAVDEDHRNLSIFQDDLKRRSIDVLRILEDLNETVRRRDIFLAAERRRLTLLASAISVGESFGTGLGTVKSLPVKDENSGSEKRSNSNISPDPIAIFRINSESEKFHQGLFGAVSAALDEAPDATFTLVAVSSSAGNASEQAERAANAKSNVSKVISSLISMGMPADRLSVSSMSVASVENTEIRLYAD